MNRKESMEMSAYTAAIRMGGNAIMCDLMPGDEFTFPHSDVVHIARKNCWYHRKDSPSCVYRTGRLTAVLQLARN